MGFKSDESGEEIFKPKKFHPVKKVHLRQKEITALHQRIHKGVEASRRMFIESRKKSGLPVVINRNGVIMKIEAKDLWIRIFPAEDIWQTAKAASSRPRPQGPEELSRMVFRRTCSFA